MACKEGMTTINGRSFYVVQMSPEKALKVQLKLVKIFSGSITKLGSMLKADLSEQANVLGEAINMLFKNSSEDEIYNFIKDVVETAKVDGEQVTFGIHFAGENFPGIFKVFFWVLKVNFADFFGGAVLNGVVDGWKKKIMEMLTEKKEPTTPPPISMPTSGVQ